MLSSIVEEVAPGSAFLFRLFAVLSFFASFESFACGGCFLGGAVFLFELCFALLLVSSVFSESPLSKLDRIMIEL